MELEHPQSPGSERTGHDHPGFYLPAMPSGSLVEVVQLIAGGIERYDLDEP